MKPLLAIAAVLLLGSSSPGLSERERAQHALNRLGFGARPGEVEKVMKLGVDRWIEQQLHPEKIADGAMEDRLARFETLAMSDSDVIREYALPMLEARRERNRQKAEGKEATGTPWRERRTRQLIEELSAQRILRAAQSERQLNEVMADFWMNHFNVFAGKGLDRFLIGAYERDTIRPRMWGRFEDLLLATAKSPAMLFYLDNARSVAEGGRARGGRRGRTMREGADDGERVTRREGGLNENYARELMELHTLGVDGGYTQKDVTELARVLTGWSITRPERGRVEFVFRAAAHDRGAKTVLGQSVPAGGGIEEGERLIRFLARHPSTARTIATKLAQRLVADDPPRALVERVAKRFLESGGDLRATVEAIVQSPEFHDPRYYRAKVKSPFEYAISAIRASGARIDDPLPVARELKKIGEPLYFAQLPTGYSDRSDAWVNSGALMARLNFAIALAANRLPGVRVEVTKLGRSAGDLSRSLTGGELSAETLKTVTSRGSDPQLVAALILGSPEFQKQ